MAIMSLSSSCCRDPRHERGTGLIPDVAAKLGQAVDDLLDGLLVAGNGSCREDDGIALVDGERLVLAVGHAGQGRQRLALRTGAHDDDLIVGQVINVEGIDDIASSMLR